jgi:hypothetical protein
MGEVNTEVCPVCGVGVFKNIQRGSRITCKNCGSEFYVRWNRDRRNYVFVNMADRGKGEPLGLPRGSVRAILIMTISLICWILFIFGRDVPNYLLNLVLIMVGYYFAFRGAPLTYCGSSAGNGKDTKNPLHLPKGVVRWIVVGGFLISMVVLLAAGRMSNDAYMEFSIILVGLVLGYISRKARVSWLKIETPSWIRHTKAVLLISIAIFLFVLFMGGWENGIDPLLIRLSMATIGFYFGSRG